LAENNKRVDGPKKVSKKYRLVDAKMYQQIVDAFRENPGNCYQVMKKVDCGHATAKRAWEQGWPKRGYPPIKEALKSEQVVARSRIEQEAELKMAEGVDRSIEQGMTLERARQDAIKTLAEEGQLLLAARRGAIGINAAVGYMSPAIVAMAKDLRDDYLKNRATYTEAQKERKIRNFGLLARDVIPLAKIAIEMQRLYMGEPTEIIAQGHISEFDDMTTEELFQQVEGVSELLQKAQDRGALICLDGGKAEAKE
jgi:hypothetical protein